MINSERLRKPQSDTTILKGLMPFEQSSYKSRQYQRNSESSESSGNGPSRLNRVLQYNYGSPDETMRQQDEDDSQRQLNHDKLFDGEDQDNKNEKLEAQMQSKRDQEDIKAMEELLNQLLNDQEEYQQNNLSLTFVDSNLEKDYFIRKQLPNVDLFGKIIVVQIILVNLTDTIFETIEYFEDEDVVSEHQVTWKIFSGAIIFAVALSHYLLSRRYAFFARSFAWFQTLFNTVLLVERALANDEDKDDVDTLVVLLMIIHSLAYVSYCQRTMLVVHATLLIYLVARMYSHYEGAFDRWIRFSIFYILAIGSTNLFSRKRQQRERDFFIQKRARTQILGMFSSLLRVFHDGIILSDEEKIIMHNRQSEAIFEIKSSTEQLNQDASLKDVQLLNKNEDDVEPANNIIISFLKGTTPDLQKSQNIKKRHQTLSLWDRILKIASAKKSNNSSSQQSDEQSNGTKSIQHELEQDRPMLLNGEYFDFNSNINAHSGSNHDSHKKLQAFSQIIKLGSKQIVLTTIRDMSQWLDLERQEHMQKLKTVAFAQAAHEFRNPLNGIIQSLDLIASHPSNLTLQQKYFNVAKNCSTLMQFLVNDILDFAQFENSKLLLNCKKVVNISCLVDDCVEILKFKADMKGIELKQEIGSNVPRTMQTDPNRLSQIIINLISNAIKYTKVGFVRLEVTYVQPTIHFTIRDSGVGIQARKMQDLFSEFQKDPRRRDINEYGVGLGLTISRNLAHALGGDIIAHSSPGLGSKFIISLPLRDADNPLEEYQMEDQIVYTAPGFTVIQLEDNIMEAQKSSNFRRIGDDGAMATKRKPRELREQEGEPPAAVAPQKLQRQRSKTKRLPSRQLLLEEIVPQRHWVNTIDLKNAHYLIVDDEPFNVMALEGLLQLIGVGRISKAFNGCEALEIIKREHVSIDVIMTDNQMPEMKGVELAERVRALQSKGEVKADIPILLVSGDIAYLDNLKMAEKNSKRRLFDSFLPKPFTMQKLQSTLSELGLLG